LPVPLLTSITSPVIETDNGEDKNVITLAISSALTKRPIEFLSFVLSTTSVQTDAKPLITLGFASVRFLSVMQVFIQFTPKKAGGKRGIYGWRSRTG